MPDHTRIYIEEAEKYHLLISKQPLLHDVIGEIRPIAGLDIVDVGAGTGRLTAVLAPKAKSIIATDESAGMLEVNAKRLKERELGNWRTIVAEHRNLLLENASADLVVAGWTIAYLANDEIEDGEVRLRAAIAEMKRVLRPGGTIIILETMGTGEEQPNPPAILKNYYKRLQEEYRFSYKWIRTDYTFDSAEQAEELTRFFFGDALADRVKQEQLKTVPECAGVWWLHV